MNKLYLATFLVSALCALTTAAPAVSEDKSDDLYAQFDKLSNDEKQEVLDFLLREQQLERNSEQQDDTAYPGPQESKRAQTFVRFGKRAQTFVRFGKRAQTFVRFG